MTEKIFLKDSYAKECKAIVQKADGRLIALDRTVFYPQGGGQPSDTGKIYCNGLEYKVLFAKKTGEDVNHEIEKDGLKQGDKVMAVIDWKQRHKLMRMHTASHVIARAVSNQSSALITGNQLGTEQSRMDFNVKEFDREKIMEAEKEANEAIRRQLDVSVEFLPVEQALKFPELVRLKDTMPKELKEWRIVSIGNYDRQADGGTHVKNTEEIGKIKITKLENKGADNRRLYFELE